MHLLLKLFISLFLCLSFINSYAQDSADSIYYERLFFTCKMWGHVKYYHTEVANGFVDWDDVLINSVDSIKAAPDNEAFNKVLLDMLDHAGPMKNNSGTLPIVPDSLNIVLDKDWIHNPIFADTIQSILDTINQRFRPQWNVYVEPNNGTVPKFGIDDSYYTGEYFPIESIRILSLFRYWNIIEYFSPNKSILDQDWDSTLIEFIPLFVHAQSEIDYHLTAKKLSTRIVDSHASFSSTVYRNWRGTSYPPFLVRFIENEMVVTKVLPDVSNLNVGDIIKEIDGYNVYELRDSLRQYAHGSNDIYLENQLNEIILYGEYGLFQITIENETGTDSINLIRNTINSFLLSKSEGEVWRDTTLQGNCSYGIVDMGKLKTSHINAMMTEFYDKDAIIFDIRNYPNGTLYDLLHYLSPDEDVQGVNFAVPKSEFPGTMVWAFNSLPAGGEPTYPGEIFILFDERTISHAEFTCMYLENHPNATKIGSQTAGADGNVSYIYLPGGIRTRATFLGTYYPDFTPTQRIGIVPDIEVKPTIKGIREGRDEVLEYALECLSVDLTETEHHIHIKIYPNPATSTLNFEIPGTTDCNISIYSLAGKEIISMKALSLNHAMDVSSLQIGMYVVKIQMADQVFSTLFSKN